MSIDKPEYYYGIQAFYVQDERLAFLFLTKVKYQHPYRQCHGAIDGKE